MLIGKYAEIDSPQCATGQGARAITEGEFHSASAIDAVMPGLVPKATGWGQYDVGEKTHVYFFLGDLANSDLVNKLG